MLIYVLTNKINNKMYVGQTKTSIYQRMKSHKYGNQNLHLPLKRAIRKYGIDNFDIDTMKVDENKINIYEMCLIQRLNTLAPNGYNISSGGNASRNGCIPWNKGKQHSEQTRLKMSKNHADFSLEKHPQSRSVVLITPIGNIIEYSCITEAANANNLNRRCLNRVVAGERSHHKGYKAFCMEDTNDKDIL
jgi:group I intron endonuclease